MFSRPCGGNSKNSRSKKRNVIFMVSDGMGMESLNLARLVANSPENLNIENYFLGTAIPKTVHTESGPLDDTAIACAINADNGASVGLLSSGLPCGSILEAAKKGGYRTGMVVTSRITDDTPAAFSSHVRNKVDEDLIAQHQLGQYPLGKSVDLMIGGGRCHFLPTSAVGGCRQDSKNLWETAKNEGWSCVENMKQYQDLGFGNNVSLPLLALLAPSNLPFEIDRSDDLAPSLESTTKTAFQALSKATKDSDRGFFLVIEGSRIDHAGHDNDPITHAHEILAFDKAFKAAVEFAQESEIETIVISTSNHETGGLEVELTQQMEGVSLGKTISHSSSYLAKALSELKVTQEMIPSVISDFFSTHLSGFEFSKEELNDIIRKLKSVKETKKLISQAISRRSLVSWGSDEHTTKTVGVYGYAKNPRILRFLHKKLSGEPIDLTQIVHILENLMHVQLGSITKELNQVDEDEESDMPMHGGNMMGGGMMMDGSMMDSDDVTEMMSWMGKNWAQGQTEGSYRCPGME